MNRHVIRCRNENLGEFVEKIFSEWRLSYQNQKKKITRSSYDDIVLMQWWLLPKYPDPSNNAKEGPCVVLLSYQCSTAILQWCKDTDWLNLYSQFIIYGQIYIILVHCSK